MLDEQLHDVYGADRCECPCLRILKGERLYNLFIEELGFSAQKGFFVA